MYAKPTIKDLTEQASTFQTNPRMYFAISLTGVKKNYAGSKCQVQGWKLNLFVNCFHFKITEKLSPFPLG